MHPLHQRPLARLVMPKVHACHTHPCLEARIASCGYVPDVATVLSDASVPGSCVPQHIQTNRCYDNGSA